MCAYSTAPVASKFLGQGFCERPGMVEVSKVKGSASELSLPVALRHCPQLSERC